MSSRLARVAVWGAGLATLGAAPAGAQPPADRPGMFSRLSFGVEATATLAPADPDAFFNYTDYERDALRLARVRLLAEWHTSPTLSFVTELQTVNASDVHGAAYYLRWKPLTRVDLTIQAGRIPPLIGAFPRRAYGRENPVIGTPLAYQYLISLRPDALPATTDDLLRMRGRGWQPSYPVGASTPGPGVPLVSASRWDTGAEALWRTGVVEIAGSITLGAAAVPAVTDRNDGRQYSGRVSVAVPRGPTLGLSASQGHWTDAAALSALPPGADRSNTQRVVALDAEYGRGPWLFRAESVRAAFEVPLANRTTGARLISWSSFGEVRYRWHPRWQVAGRVDHIDFDRLTRSTDGARLTWDAPVRRVEAVVGFRVTRAFDLRAGWQHNWRDGGRVRRRGVPVVALLYRF